MSQAADAVLSCMQGGPQRRHLQDSAAPEFGCPGAHNLTMLPGQQSPGALFKFLLNLQDCFAGMVCLSDLGVLLIIAWQCVLVPHWLLFAVSVHDA